ncbi:hypothetical protein P4114_15990 [Pseudomonas aeruginosa]|nr:hypothetical protein [Pseudomonas aeruginosa]
MAGFSELVADMDEIIADVLGDGEFGYLDRSGRQVGNAAVIVEEGVERMEAGALDRYRTIACRKAELQPLDRKGRSSIPMARSGASTASTPTTATGSLSTWCPNERRDRCTDRGHRPTAGPAGCGTGVRRRRP